MAPKKESVQEKKPPDPAPRTSFWQAPETTFAFRKLSRVLNILLTNLSQYPLHDENLAPSYSTYLHSMTLLRQRSQDQS